MFPVSIDPDFYATAQPVNDAYGHQVGDRHPERLGGQREQPGVQVQQRVVGGGHSEEPTSRCGRLVP